jgi:16S rRNA (uracil1498-N3)-methyltransferase
MKHVPHIVVGAPWDGLTLSPSVIQWRHLTKVLRLNNGDHVSYTDGLGHVGEGVLGDRTIQRGEEWEVPRPMRLIVAVAPPASKDRQRFLVEKLAELGVERLLWLKTHHGQGRIPSGPKAFAWILAAVEQSRGGWLMEVNAEFVSWEELEGPLVVCHSGEPVDAPPPHARTVVVGPEGGFSEDEIPANTIRWDLGPTVLRVETAAVVAVSRMNS